MPIANCEWGAEMDHFLAVIGYSNSGKTTLVEALVPALKARGYRVGTVKHTHHSPEFDQTGKDSFRHFAAGADTALLDAGQTLSMVKRLPAVSSGSAGLKALAPYFDDVDLVIAEGYKSADCPKIEVYRPGSGPPLCRTVPNVIAVVTETGARTDAETGGGFPVSRFASTQMPDIVEMIERCIIEKNRPFQR